MPSVPSWHAWPGGEGLGFVSEHLLVPVVRRPVHRSECVLEHVIRHALTLRDSLGLIEPPARVAPVVARDCVRCIEHRDMHYGHCPARSKGPKLLAEDPVLARRHRRVVEPAGVDRHLVPKKDLGGRAAPVPLQVSRRWPAMSGGSVPRPPGAINAARNSLRPGRGSETQGRYHQRQDKQRLVSFQDDTYSFSAVPRRAARGRRGRKPA